MPKVTSSARNAAHAVGKRLTCCSLTSADHDAHTGMTGNGRRFLGGAWPSKTPQRNRTMQIPPKLKFDRVEMSRKMKDIVEQLKPVCAKVSTILQLELWGPNRKTTQGNAMNRPKTTPEIIEPELYGRNNQKKKIVDGITHGKYCADELTVLPIVGPGGIGKTTFTQHIYKEVKSSFQVMIWICVSLDFNANRLTQEIVKKIPEDQSGNKNVSDEERIEQTLKSKRFLLVLDDVWTYHDDEWNKLLAPFRKGEAKGNMVIVTTRIPEVANMVRTIDCSIELERLGPEDILSFFEACVFGHQQPWKDYTELHDVGIKIVGNLKGFPLAAKTVGRLLRNQLTLDHWTRVLESKEWELQTSENDIMPALKLSYDYLPFHLQQCFSYCALFPEDYEFASKELVHMWIGLDILRSCDQKKRIEDIGLCYLNDLVNHGFFRKNESHYYVIHDLLHELAVKVSSYECLSIYSSNVRSIQIPPSVHHLSIIVDNTDVKDRMTFEDYKKDLGALDKRLKVENLRTLMLFGQYHGSFAKIFGDLFKEARALRSVFLSGVSYTVEDMLHNFSKLVHLRYLRIKSVVYAQDMCLPSALSRLYHLEVIDLEGWKGCFGSTRNISNLVKLRHFLVPRLQLHSDIFEVGKLKFFQELRRFEVGKESKGFELSQLGELTELGGSLGIYNLEKTQAKEAKELKLIHKNHLHKLILEWDINRSNKDHTREENVVESLVPPSNLRDICIRGHGGTNCPKWLGANLSVKSLEALRLDDVSWKDLPPLGDVWLVNELGEECQSCISGQSFQNLKRLELVKIPKLKKWVGNSTCHLFSTLEVLIIEDCSELMDLPFSHSACYQPEQGADTTLFPRLRELSIVDCPKLLSLPPIPWTLALCSAKIERAGSGFEHLLYSEDYKSDLRLQIKGEGGEDSVFWNGLAFHNLTNLKELIMVKCPPLSLDHLQMLTSLKGLRIRDCSSVLLPVEGESHVTYQFPVESIYIERCSASGKELTQLLSHFPDLIDLKISHCHSITEIGVVEQQMTASEQQQHQTRGEEEIAAAREGLLLLPPQLQELWIHDCPELILLSNSLDDDNAEGGGGGGLQGLRSLRSLWIFGCPKLLSSYSSSSFLFPTSLQVLSLEEGMETVEPLSNLTSLTELSIYKCGDLRGEGIWHILAEIHLTRLTVFGAPKFFADSKLSSSLTQLTFTGVKEERFTKEQEEALLLLTSLQDLTFLGCDKLQRLPAGLHRLASLKRLRIDNCQAIRSLCKDGLPSSLEELVIKSCPDLKSLPKDGLPSSLRVLQVIDSEELKRQSRKLTGTIPMIKYGYY